MLESFFNKITNKNIYRSLFVIFLISLFPIIMLAFYNYPCADDFSASDTVYWAWKNTGSILEVIRAAWDNVIFNYMEWSGVFMSVFWTSLQFGIFGEKYYGLVTVLAIGFLVIGSFYLGHVIFDKYFKADKYLSRGLILLYLFIIIQCMPNGNEGLYWHAGVVNYTWAFAFLLMLLAVVLSILKEDNIIKMIIKIMMASILAVFVGGGNYLTALQGSLWLFAMWVIIILSAVTNKENIKNMFKKYSVIMLPTIALLVSFGISVLAPGNEARMSISSGMSPIKAVLVSFYYLLNVWTKEGITWPVIVVILISIPLMWNIVGKCEFKFRYPGMIALVGFGMVAAAFTPNLYAQGDVGGGRLADTIFFIWIFWIYVVLFYIVGWMRNKVLYEVKTKENGASRSWRRYLVGMLAFWIICSVLTTRIEPATYVGTQALESIMSGEAKNYKDENEKRLELLYDSQEKNIVFQRFLNSPDLLSFQDITADENDWLNQAMAQYYGKESVRCE